MQRKINIDEVKTDQFVDVWAERTTSKFKYMSAKYVPLYFNPYIDSHARSRSTKSKSLHLFWDSANNFTHFTSAAPASESSVTDGRCCQGRLFPT